ncbi:MAG: hypothetical protein GY854_12890 [Deltaproteobacteria bacterium]|nr:hypothetical protein [Deltaproteobacteria bacterium]
MTNAPPQTRRTLFPGILLISAATLLLEVGWTRVLSVTLWYHFAFMILSTALFGFGFAGVALSLRRKAQVISSRFIATAACCTPFAFAAGYTAFNLIPFEPFSLGRDPWQWLYLPLSFLAVTLPFFFSGLTIAGLLTRHARAVHNLYLFDLVGAGLGGLLAVIALPALGGTGTILGACALASAGATLTSLSEGPRWSVAAGCIAAVFLAAAPMGDRLLPVRISNNKVTGDGVPIAEVFSNPRIHKFTDWNTISRVDVIEWQDRRRRTRRSILIDGGTAVTRLAHPRQPIADLKPGSDDESFFMRLSPAPRVLVVGSGGAREVVLALAGGAKNVDAVELNPAINAIVSEQMADFTGRVYEDPRVHVFTDEARSFLRRSEIEYDIIHCPHTISNAAMASGSLSLAENYLMTLEAFDDYLAHLADDGVLLITRPEAHLPRLFSTARAALEAHSNEPIAPRVIAWRRPSEALSFYAGFALRRTPFTKDELAQFEATLTKNGLEPLHLPGRTSSEPYRSLVSGTKLDDVPLSFDAILEPATDDKPFFNRRARFSDIKLTDVMGMFSRGAKGRAALEDRPVAETALLILLIETVVIAFLLIAGPLLVFRRQALEGKDRLKTLVAFFFLGLAYITVEVGFIQRLTLYIGRPTVVFATVLGTLLVSSGIGSAIARRFTTPSAPRRASLVAGGVALLAALALSPVIDATLALPEMLRVTTAILFLIPPGLVMGMPFPLLIRQLEISYHERIPWAFGINGLASVMGTITAVLIAMTQGQTSVLLVGVLCYFIAASAARLTNS